MNHEFRNADAKDNLGFALEGIGQVPCDFGVSERNVGLIQIEPIAFLFELIFTLASTLFSFSAVARRLMHLPRVVIYLLIRFAYSSRLPFD